MALRSYHLNSDEFEEVVVEPVRPVKKLVLKNLAWSEEDIDQLEEIALALGRLGVPTDRFLAFVALWRSL